MLNDTILCKYLPPFKGSSNFRVNGALYNFIFLKNKMTLYFDLNIKYKIFKNFIFYVNKNNYLQYESTKNLAYDNVFSWKNLYNFFLEANLNNKSLFNVDIYLNNYIKKGKIRNYDLFYHNYLMGLEKGFIKLPLMYLELGLDWYMLFLGQIKMYFYVNIYRLLQNISLTKIYIKNNQIKNKRAFMLKYLTAYSFINLNFDFVKEYETLNYVKIKKYYVNNDVNNIFLSYRPYLMQILFKLISFGCILHDFMNLIDIYEEAEAEIDLAYEAPFVHFLKESENSSFDFCDSVEDLRRENVFFFDNLLLTMFFCLNKNVNLKHIYKCFKPFFKPIRSAQINFKRFTFSLDQEEIFLKNISSWNIKKHNQISKYIFFIIFLYKKILFMKQNNNKFFIYLNSIINLDKFY